VPAQPAHDPTKDVKAILGILEAGVVDQVSRLFCYFRLFFPFPPLPPLSLTSPLLPLVQQNITHFYPPGSLPPIAQRIANSGALAKIASSLHLPMEIAMDMARLALFDTVLYLDDSGSMTLEDRIPQLQALVSQIAFAAGLFDEDGVNVRLPLFLLRPRPSDHLLPQVRWMNSKKEGNNFTQEGQVVDLISKIKFNRGASSLYSSCLSSVLTEPPHVGTPLGTVRFAYLRFLPSLLFLFLPSPASASSSTLLTSRPLSCKSSLTSCPLAQSLKEKVLEPFITKPAKKGKLRKPVLVVCVTDGAPTFEPKDTIVKVRCVPPPCARRPLRHFLEAG
jgi:hypothetical protein